MNDEHRTLHCPICKTVLSGPPLPRGLAMQPCGHLVMVVVTPQGWPVVAATADREETALVLLRRLQRREREARNARFILRIRDLEGGK